MARLEDETEPADSSSAEEDEQLSSEGAESESDPDKTSTPKNSQLITPNSTSGESEPDDKTSDNPPVLDPNIKPLTSIPMDDDQAKLPTGKRPAPEAEIGDLKRIKQEMVVTVAALDADNGGEKKQLFQRLWSEDNEIELIQGMINYVDVKGKDPLANVIDFHEFVKKSLHVDVNTRQLLTKGRRLKKKYENNVAKVDKKMKVKTFSNPHEKRMYELSITLWGNHGNKNAITSSKTKKVNVTPKTNKSHNVVASRNGNQEVEEIVNVVEPISVAAPQPLWSNHGFDHLGQLGLPISEEVIKNMGLELLSGQKKVEMEEKWKNLKVQELKHFLKKVELLKDHAKLMLNAMSKPDAS